MGELGEHLGYLERNNTAGCAKPRAGGDDRTRVGSLPYQPGLGAVLSRCTCYGVFASRWPLGDKTLWTIVNRNEYDVDGRADDRSATRLECVTSISITASNSRRDREGGNDVLSFSIEAHGYGAVLATPGDPTPRRKI